jgi:phosphoglycolate phosphatase
MTTYGLIVTFFPIFVSFEKKIVSGPIIFTPDLIKNLRNFSCSILEFICFIWKYFYIKCIDSLIHNLFLKNTLLMTQKYSILFDLDGTLVDTAPDLMNAHNHVMKKYGYPTKSTADIRNLVGQGAGAMIGRSIWGQAKKEFGKIDDQKIKAEMVKDFVNFYGKNIIKESTLINGVIEFLKWCKEKEISMAVCTNKQEHLAIDLLKKIGIYDYFEYVAGSDTFDYCKPDPRHITSIIEIIGGDIKKSLMFGDSETDANAAKAASVPVILLENGYTEKNSNEIYHNHLIKDFIGVEKIVSTYLKD